MSFRPIAMLGALAVCVALFPAPAAAKKVALKTRIEPLFIIKDNPTEYLVSGKLISKSPGCRFRRTIRLNALHPDNTDTVIASRRTKSGVGLFNFRVPLTPSDRVYVTTPAKEFVTKAGTTIHCATGRSIPQSVT